MKPTGQVLVIVAVALIVGLFLLALIVDGGRLYLERVRLARSAQSAADAGSGWVAGQMVTQVVARQTQAGTLPPCLIYAEFGNEHASCTATPEVDEIHHWLTDEDRATLISPPAQSTVEALALEYARRNDLQPDDPNVAELRVEYPHEYDPRAERIRLWVEVRRRTSVLLAGLLGEEFVELQVEAVSELRQR